jgi:hypothetical protein
MRTRCGSSTATKPKATKNISQKAILVAFSIVSAKMIASMF